MAGIPNPLQLLTFCLVAYVFRPGIVMAQETTEPAIEQSVREVVALLNGSMSTSAQASSNPKVSDVRLVTCPINLQGPPNNQKALLAIYLYQEQALSNQPEKPYRQRFLRIAPAFNQQSVESLAFKPAELSRWVGFCDRPMEQRTVSVNELGTSVCQVFLKKSGSEYVGRTPIDGCAANYRGAIRITNRVVLNQQGMETWDKGFNALGQQVWGAVNDSYKFQRTTPISQ